MKKEIYFDHAATTTMWPRVQRVMEPYMQEKYMNASAHYDGAKQAKAAIEEAREKIAQMMDASPEEIYFTSGGSESDNWVIKSIAGEYKNKGIEIVTDTIEHHAVLNSCSFLEELGYSVSYVNPDEKGIVHPNAVAEAMGPKMNLVSIMYGNNEIGTIEPIEDICRLVHARGGLFHTDAVQAVGQIPVSLKKLSVDALSASAHKFHGPKGVGFLFVRKSVEIPSFIHGGSQEKGKRAGTENVAGIVGMAEALSISVNQMEKGMEYVSRLRDYMIGRILYECPDCRLNGSYNRLPGNVNISFADVEASTLLILLEESGICASAGSACNTGKSRLSHVIEAIRVPERYAPGTVRFTLGVENTRQEVDYTIRVLKESLYLLREL